MDFGYVLKRAWEIIWKFKILWIFGILASCGQASTSGGSNSGYRFSVQENNLFPQFNHFFAQPDPAVIALLIGAGIFFILAVIVLAILFGTIGRIGLIRGTVEAEHGAERLTFGQLWREGLKYFWRVFGLNLLVGIVIFIAFMVILFSGIALSIATLGLFLLCLLPLMCLFIPLMWAISVVIEQANVALVVENLGITEAIGRGWRVVRDNIGSMLVMSLVLILGVGLIGGIIIGLPMLIVSAPAMIGAVNGGAAALRNGLLVSGLLFLLYLPVLFLLSGILRSYTSSAWTLTFMKLTNKASLSSLETSTPAEELVIPPASGV
jgi:hypothetical protein